MRRRILRQMLRESITKGNARARRNRFRLLWTRHVAAHHKPRKVRPAQRHDPERDERVRRVNAHLFGAAMGRAVGLLAPPWIIRRATP